MKYGIGTKKILDCFDGKKHECTILDCSVILSGRTFENKATIKADHFRWWSDEKFWVKQVDNEDDIDALVKKYENLGVKVTIEQNFRITDEEIVY